MVEFYKKHRPTTLNEVVGQEKAVRLIRDKLKSKSIPHAILLAGPSGVGKTTLARIIANELGCAGLDFCEINCAVVDAMDTIREIQKAVYIAPMGGKCRVWLLDEIQSLSRAPFAQQGLLKILEETPQKSYLMLATTDPNKVIPTVRNRCTQIALAPLSIRDLTDLTMRIGKEEKLSISITVAGKIADMVNGSARQALVLLEQISEVKGQEQQLEELQKADLQVQAIELARGLIAKAPWRDIAKILKSLEGEEAEGLRYMILAYCRTIMLGGGPKAQLAFAIVQSFRDNFYDSKHAGLAAACWEICGK